MHTLKYTLVYFSALAELKCCLLVNCMHSFATEQAMKKIHQKSI